MSIAGSLKRASGRNFTRRLLASASIAAVLAACILAIGPVAAAVVAGGITLTLIAIYRPMVVVSLSFFAAFAALPTIIPRALPIAGVSIELYEVFSAFAAVGLLLRTPKRRHTDLPALVLALLLITASALSVASQIGTAYVLNDARRLLILAVGLFIAGRAAASVAQAPRRYLRILAAMMWFSAVLTALASITGLDLGQRALIASLDPGEDGSAARLITNSTYLAVVILCVCLYLYLRSALRASVALWLALPSALIVILSFSRNPILALAVAAAAGLAHSRGTEGASRVVRGMTILATALAGIWALGLLDPTGSLNNWLSRQMSGIFDRVLVGSTGDALASDKSTLYRTQQEDPYLWEALRNSPIWGHGLGSPYKPEYTGRRYVSPEIAAAASRYAHNFFLWMAVKTGLLGLLVFLACTLRPVTSLFRPSSHSVMTTALSAALLGMFLQSWVAPMPNGTPTALLFGALVGAGIASARQMQGENSLYGGARSTERATSPIL